MRRSRLMVTLATAGLLAVGMAVFTAWALDEEEGSCAAACREAKERCLTSCGAHSNPIECDDRCEEEAEDCVEQCE